MSTTLPIDARVFFGVPPAFFSSGWQQSAVSCEAEAVARDMCEVDNTFESSQALFGNKTEVISELWATASECSEENWDGNGAAAIELWAVRKAERFIRVLPEGVPMPEVTPEPDGSIGLDWSESRSRVFSVSFGPGLRLAYAWLDGTDRGHAVARFDGEAIPRRILDGIRELTHAF